MLGKLIMIPVLLAIGFIGGARFIEWADTRQDFDCTFNRMSDRYTITARELAKSTSLVIVTKEHRTFAFQRREISACIETPGQL